MIPDNNESQHSSNQKNELDRGKNKLDGHLLGPKVHQNDTSERKAEMSLALRCFPGSVLHPQRQFTAFLEKLDLLYGLHGAFEEIHVQFLAKKTDSRLSMVSNVRDCGDCASSFGCFSPLKISHGVFLKMR